MKIQDIIFIIILVFLLYKKDSRFFIIAGILSLILSIPLFTFWIFFTAEKLISYAAVFFFLAIIIEILKLKKQYNNFDHK